MACIVLPAPDRQTAFDAGLRPDDPGERRRPGPSHFLGISRGDEVEVRVRGPADRPRPRDQPSRVRAPGGQRCDEGWRRCRPDDLVTSAVSSDCDLDTGIKNAYPASRGRPRRVADRARTAAAALRPVASSAGVPFATILPTTRTAIRSATCFNVGELVAREKHRLPATPCCEDVLADDEAASGSMPAVGSSRMSTSGRPTRATANANRWRSPTDRRRNGVRCGSQAEGADQLVSGQWVRVERGVLEHGLGRARMSKPPD